MTLKDLGNLGEFVGAIGVVVSLVYLALQIHQNTRHVSERLQRGSADGTTLTPADSQRFALLMQEFFFSYRALYLRAEEKVMPWGSWESTLALIAGLLRSPGIRDWWSHQKAIFEPGFIAAIERAAASRA